MELKIKNKNLLTLQHVLDKSNKVGGVPRCFEVHPTEAYQILRELNDLYNSTKQSIGDIKIEQMQGWFENGHFKSEIIQDDVRKTLYSKIPLSRKDGEDLIKRWYAGEFKMTYKDVEICIIPNPKAKKYNVQATITNKNDGTTHDLPITVTKGKDGKTTFSGQLTPPSKKG